jgi:hypothetical protein
VKPSHYVAASVLAVLVSVAGVWVASPAPRRASGSALSQGHDGWLAARRYLEARGVSVSLLGDASTDPRGVLALVFPWQRFGPDLSLHRTRRQLARGGTVLFAYTPQVQDAEREVAATMGMGHQPAPDPPLHPLRWRAYAAATSSLLPEDADSGRAPLLVSASRARLTPPVHATILFRDESGRPASFSYAHGPGRVVVVPAAAFSNARIEQGGNADLLESLVLALGTEWAFDEFQHGLMPAPASAANTANMRAMDAFLLQLALVYALAVLAVSRRFGPPWDDPPVVAGSTAAFLRGVGALHHQHGHHRQASALLLERSRLLDPRLALPDRAEARDGSDLLSLAQAVGRAQTGEERKT